MARWVRFTQAEDGDVLINVDVVVGVAPHRVDRGVLCVSGLGVSYRIKADMNSLAFMVLGAEDRCESEGDDGS